MCCSVIFLWVDKRRTDPFLLGKKCLGEVFIHLTNVGVGFVEVPRDRISQTRTPHVKDRSFNHPRGVVRNTFKRPMCLGVSLLKQMSQRNMTNG